MGTTLIKAKPFTPYAKGKIERFFHTLRIRFLSQIDPTKIKDINELNLLYWKWLEEDYHHKTHSELKRSPIDFFMFQAERVKVFSDPAMLDEYFLIKTERKVNHDATLSLHKVLYETTQDLTNSRVELRYDPEWLSNPNQPIFIYCEALALHKTTSSLTNQIIPRKCM